MRAVDLEAAVALDAATSSAATVTQPLTEFAEIAQK